MTTSILLLAQQALAAAEKASPAPWKREYDWCIEIVDANGKTLARVAPQALDADCALMVSCRVIVPALAAWAAAVAPKLEALRVERIRYHKFVAEDVRNAIEALLAAAEVEP